MSFRNDNNIHEKFIVLEHLLCVLGVMKFPVKASYLDRIRIHCHQTLQGIQIADISHLIVDTLFSTHIIRKFNFENEMESENMRERQMHTEFDEQLSTHFL